VSADRVILTPEHVQIRLQPAGLGSRFLAVTLDALISLCLIGMVGIALGMALPGVLAVPLFATAAFLITWGYHVYFETRHEGRSPGKRALRLRVVDGRGLPLSVAQSFVRSIVRVLDTLPVFYGLGGLACLLDRHHRRLGDIAADTVVVAEGRSWEPDPSAVLAPEYNSLRTPRVMRLVRRRLGLEEREFLATLVRRAGELDERARFDLMEEAGLWYRQRLELGDLPLGGEQIVRGLAAILFAGPAARSRGRAAAGRARPAR
jgi:uncharacterized RDD family membrane protein YckC